MMLSKIIILTAGLATTVSAFTCNGNYFSFFNRDGSAMSYQRLDPALFPGTVSPHLHSFDGGNDLSASTDFAQTQSSTCTTARIKPDKSLYWRPSLFWNGDGTGFHRVPEKSTKIYYKSGDGDKWANVTAFPENFNMIAGSPLKRSDGDNPASVRWACHQPDGNANAIFANGFPKGFSSCDYGFATEVTFPSCWNGKLLDPQKPSAHMAYPSGYGGVGIENCPTTHRAARFPTIFIEFWYDVSSFNGKYGPEDTPWVISNGDPTGFGFHADFLNGWEKGVLEKAIGETGGCYCGCGCGQEEMEQCFGAENVNKDDDEEFKSCAAVSADTGDAAPILKKLPGCNPLQSGPAAATAVTGAGCDASAVPVAGDNKASVSSAASKTPTSTATSSAVSSAKKTSTKAYAASAVVENDTDTLPSLSVAIPNKGVDAVSTGDYDAIVPTSSAATLKNSTKPAPVATSGYEVPVDTLPSLSIATSATPAGQTGTPSANNPSSDNGNECKPRVYVTVTPTVYVTAAANTTSCNLDTVYKTVTATATITVPAYGSVEYGKF